MTTSSGSAALGQYLACRGFTPNPGNPTGAIEAALSAPAPQSGRERARSATGQWRTREGKR
jgi:hypothetical protein